MTVDFTAGNPNPGDTFSLTFNLPDGTTESIQLTASSSTPLPTGSFAIGATPAATAANFNAAAELVDLERSPAPRWSRPRPSRPATISSTPRNGDRRRRQQPGVAGRRRSRARPRCRAPRARDSLTSSFAPGDTITINGTTLTFVASGAAGNQINVTDNVQTLLSKIDQITGTSTPSTVHGGVITLHTDDASTLSVASSNATAFAALGFGGTVTAAQPPLRVSGSPLSSATSLVNGSANTVKWYTGNSGPGSARSTATVRVDSSQTVQFGAQANEQAIRSAIQAIATYAAVTVSPTGTNSPAAVNALSQRVASNLTRQIGQQSIQDIQTDFATAQTTMKDATARQTQTQAALQSLVDQTEGINQNQVASQILALQNSLQASYQTTAMLSQLSLTKFLPVA